MRCALQEHKSVKWYASIDVEFHRTTADGSLQETTARFRTIPVVLTVADSVDADGISNHFLGCIDNFNRRGSGWQVQCISDFRITLAPFRPAQGSSYIPTPKDLAMKKAIVNVQNKDEYCFIWSILAAKYPVKGHPERVTHYNNHFDEFDITNLSFPLSICNIPKFESLNPNISVNVLMHENREIIPLYVTPHRNSQLHVNLLLISNSSGYHYTLVRNLSRLVAERTNRRKQTFVCPYCIHCCSHEDSLLNHIENCSRHNPQRVIYPEGDDAVLSYKATRKECKVPYVIYVDFESLLTTENTHKNTVNTHIPSGFCALTVSIFETCKPVVYSGPDTMTKFFNHIYQEQHRICARLGVNRGMNPLSEREKITYGGTTHCRHCNRMFSLSLIHI